MLVLPPALLAFDIRGTLSITTSGVSPVTSKVVFQKCHPDSATHFVGNHSPRMMRAHVIPFDPKSPAQMMQRNKMRLAVAAWHILPNEARYGWQEEGKMRSISGFNAFISDYMKTL